MSTSKKILALAAGAAMVLSAGTAAEAARAGGRQQAMVPLGMDQVDPSWVVPSFVQLDEAPKKVVKMSDKEKANAALAPVPAPAGDKAPVPSPTTLTAKAPVPAAEKPKEEKAAAPAPAAKPAAKEEEVAAPAPADAAADANAEPTESGAEESEEVVEESESESSDDGESTASDKPDPVDGTMPGHVWVKSDNDETNDKKDDDYKHIPGVHLLPKGKALERSAATLANIAKAKTEAAKAKDEADSAKAEAKVAATEKKEHEEEKKKADSANAAAVAKEEAKNTVSGPDADKLAQTDAAKDKTVVAVNPAKEEHATKVTKKAIEQTKPNLEGDKKIEAGSEVPAAKKEPDAGLEKEKVPAAAAAKK